MQQSNINNTYHQPTSPFDNLHHHSHSPSHLHHSPKLQTGDRRIHHNHHHHHHQSSIISIADNSSLSQSNAKRKRSWSRAVFSQLQRKGLEIQFQIQKYITKPDRRKLAARLGLTDAQVSTQGVP